MKWMLMLAVVSFSVPSFAEDKTESVVLAKPKHTKKVVSEADKKSEAQFRTLLESLRGVDAAVKSGACDLRK